MGVDWTIYTDEGLKEWIRNRDNSSSPRHKPLFCENIASYTRFNKWIQQVLEMFVMVASESQEGKSRHPLNPGICKCNVCEEHSYIVSLHRCNRSEGYLTPDACGILLRAFKRLETHCDFGKLDSWPTSCAIKAFEIARDNTQFIHFS